MGKESIFLDAGMDKKGGVKGLILPFRISSKASVYIIFLIVLVPASILIIINSPNLGNIITGMASFSVLEVDSFPRITINDSVYYVNQLVNFSDCGYDMRGGELNCTFSDPLDHELGTWTPGWGDIGIYDVQINATNNWDETSIKNVTLMISSSILEGECDMNLTVEEDHKLMVTWNKTLPINDFEYANYTEFTLSYVDYLTNATFNLTDAVNVTINDDNFYFDNTANETKERYYKLFGHHDGKTYVCNQTFGKVTNDLTMNYGRWNYISSPFLRKNTTLFSFLEQAKDDMQYAYKYNHEVGSFDYHIFSLGFGNIDGVDYNECLLLQPNQITKVTTAGEIMKNISANFTGSYGRWNYMGWVPEDTSREEAFSDYETDIQYLYIYNHETGSFDYHIFSLNFGNIDSIPPATCNLIQPHNEMEYEYKIHG